MTATVETDVDDIATQAVNLAYRAARGETAPAPLSPPPPPRHRRERGRSGDPQTDQSG